MKKADYILKSRAVFTSCEDKPFNGFVAVAGDRIVGVEEGDDCKSYEGEDTRLIDYGDRLIVPGFIDAHVHFFDGTVTSSEHMCQIFESTSEEDAVRIIREYRASHPEEKRIRALGWFPANWNDAPLPSIKSLDDAFPDIPVYCISADMHTFWMNSLALEESGYTSGFEPPSGSVGRDDDGKLNGLLFEPGAFLPAMMKVMEFTKEERKNNFSVFMDHIVASGVTSVSDMSASDYSKGPRDILDVAREMSQENTLKCRIHVFTKLSGYNDFSETVKLAREYTDKNLQISGVKGFVDGVTSTFTAYLLEPYSDRKEICGIDAPIESQSDMQQYVNAANKAGLPVRLHCIGDAAVRMALDMYEESIRVNGRHGLKNTVEHIESIAEEDIERFAELDVIASMQPMHLPLDANEKVRRIGEERCRWEWPHRTILDRGGKLAFGTDYPVVDFNPFPSLHTAVTRYDENNEPTGINPEECISLAEAIKAYTSGAAEAYGRLEDLGTLEAGKLADIAVVDRNLFDIDPTEIKDASAVMTMMGGKIVFERD